MSESRPSLVLVMEKPHQARVIAPLLKDRWPGRQVFAIFTMYLGLYEFRYPRGTAFADIPYIADPAWRPRKREDNHSPRVVELVLGKVRPTSLEPSSVLSAAGEIWFASDPDSTGAINYHVLLTQCLGADAALMERPALILNAMDGSSIQKALDAPSSTGAQHFQAWRNAGEAKRFFDFNYNVNALVLFGECLRQVGIDTAGFGLSKYGLQLLYALREVKPLSESAVLSLMHSWSGTGRYRPSQLGSAASRSEILAGLLGAGLLVDEDHQISLSARGAAFLASLHPDCADPDLPARLEVWQSDWPHSRDSVCRYLRTYFGKQRRYMR